MLLTRAGRAHVGTVDPGFVDHSGGLIWALEYKSVDGSGRETADGRFEIPDHVDVEHNVGCSLSMATEEAPPPSRAPPPLPPPPPTHRH